MGINVIFSLLKKEITNIAAKILTIFLFVTIAISASGQEKKTVEGREFYIHKVEQGSTLYSISQIYKVPVDEIKKENAFLNEGLKMGQELLIPVDKIVGKEEIEGQQKVVPEGFIEHQVQKGETLYALSKKYGIKVKDIIDNNPDVINGLKQDMILLIPQSNVALIKKEEILPEVNETQIKEDEKTVKEKKEHEYRIHIVQAKETIFSLCKLYSISEENLFEINPELNNGLKVGFELRVPHTKPEVNESEIVSDVYTDLNVNFDQSITELSDSLITQDIYNIALMLPFYLDKNDEIEENAVAGDKEKIYKKSEVALEFYQGALLALDSLRKEGVAARLYVVDSYEDSLAALENFINNKDSVDYHLIIGPLYKSNFTKISEYAKEKQISIVAPVPLSNKILLGNEYVSKTSPSRPVQMEKIAEYVVLNYQKNENVFVVNTGDEEEKNLLAAFLRKARNIEDTLNLKDSLRMVSFGKLTKDKLKLHLDSTVENVVVLPTTDAVYVYDFLTILNGFVDDYSITVFGLDKWQNFTNLDTDFLHDLKIHVTSSYFIDYENDRVNEFICKYRAKYFTEPSKYGFSGYDVMYYYVSNLDKYGVNMQSQLEVIKKEGIGNSFDFFKTGMESGFENRSTYLLKYEDYKLKRVE